LNRLCREREITESTVDKAIDTPLMNIQAKTGQTLDQSGDLLRKSGLTEHGELHSMLMRNLDRGHSDARSCAIGNPSRTVPVKARSTILALADAGTVRSMSPEWVTNW
jgi:hypothetical protein